MAKIAFITPDGESVVVNNAEGNLMEIATYNEVEGIDASCGGVCSCGTCHVRVNPNWIDRLGDKTEAEIDMLDFQPGADERSRLCCQIEIGSNHDGLILEVDPL